MNNLKDLVDYQVSEELMKRAVEQLVFIAVNGIVFTIEEYGLGLGVRYNTARNIINGLKKHGYVKLAIPTYYRFGRVGRHPAFYRPTLKVVQFCSTSEIITVKQGVEKAIELSHERKKAISRDDNVRFYYL